MSIGKCRGSWVVGKCRVLKKKKQKQKKNLFLFLFPAVTNQEEAVKKAIKESEIFLLSIFYKFFLFIINF